MAESKRYETAEALQEAVSRYFIKTEGAGEFPDYAGMKLYLGLYSEAEVKSYCEDPAFKDVFEKAKLRRESFLVRQMTKSNKLAQGCLNALKQEANGGYTDKPVDNGERKLVIELKGIGENAYK
jgi:hypothetical protein